MWKISFFLLLVLSSIVVIHLWSTNLYLSSEIVELTQLVESIDRDLSYITNGLLFEYDKDSMTKQLTEKNSGLKLFEYDLNYVKMNGLDLIFNDSNMLKSISTRKF